MIPALRERVEDIPYLTASFVRRCAREFGKGVIGITPEAEELLQQWQWPGNIRELKNVIERACLLCEGHMLTERDVHRALQERPRPPVPQAPRAVAMLSDVISGPPPTERAVRDALDETSGNKSLAARKLGVSRRALYRLIEKFDEAGAGASFVFPERDVSLALSRFLLGLASAPASRRKQALWSGRFDVEPTRRCWHGARRSVRQAPVRGRCLGSQPEAMR